MQKILTGYTFLLAVQHKRISLKFLLPIIACLLLLASIAFFLTCKYRGTKIKSPVFQTAMLLCHGDVWLVAIIHRN
jgi:hypothetical protein